MTDKCYISAMMNIPITKILTKNLLIAYCACVSKYHLHFVNMKNYNKAILKINKGRFISIENFTKLGHF